MKKRFTAIAIGVMIATALPAVAQSSDGGQGGGWVPFTGTVPAPVTDPAGKVARPHHFW